MIIDLLISLTISLSLSIVLTPIVRKYFINHTWIEDPHQKQIKTHNATALKSIPRGGGIPIFISVTTTALLFLPIDKHLVGIIAASLITLIVGVLDDIKDISPKIRLVTNFISALIVVGSGIGIAFISNPFGGVIDLSQIQYNFNFFGPHSIWVIPDILAILWIVWCMNIVGWSAGVEGQLPGFVSISAFFIGILAMRFSGDNSQLPVIILAGAVTGSYLGFLPYNFFPQTIMPGYSGKSLAGLFLAILSILSGAKLATLIILLSVPIIDAIFVLIKRLLQRRFILEGGPDHLHHSLLKIGWTRRQISFFYWFISFSLGLIALTLNSQQKLYFFICVFFLFTGFILKISRRI